MRQQTPATARIGYDPGYGRSVRIAEFDRPMMSDDVETAQTVAYMEELASFDAGERSVVNATHRALEEAGIDMGASPADKAKAIFWFLKRTIRYVPTPATSALVDQTLIAPSALLAMRDPEGDCPQFSMLAAAMFRVCCIPSMFKTIAAEPSLPEIFSHIYNVVEVAPGKFMPFDSSNGPAPGAEYAAAFKQRVWPRTIPDRCSSRSMRQRGKLMLRNSGARHGWRNRGLRGTVCDDAGNCYDDGSDIASQIATINDLSDSVYGGISTPASTPVSTPSSSSSFTGFLSTLANDVTSLASPIIKSATAPKPYYITNAAGQQVLYNPATGQTVTSSIGSSMPLLIGLGVIVALAVAKK